jgi:hypothetical protein
VSPDTANAPHRHHTRHCHPTVRPSARRAATSRAKQPAEGRAQLAEKALIAHGVKGWLQPQRAHAPAARRQRLLLWRSQRGVLRGGSARPSCARWARRKLSGQPLGATDAGARAGLVARAPYTKSTFGGLRQRNLGACAERPFPIKFSSWSSSLCRRERRAGQTGSVSQGWTGRRGAGE